MKTILAMVLVRFIEIVVLIMFLTPPGWCILIPMLLLGKSPLKIQDELTDRLASWAGKE